MENTVCEKVNLAADLPLVAEYLRQNLRYEETGEAALCEPALSVFDRLDASFSERVMQQIQKAGITPKEFYSRANLSRQLFHKLNANPEYRPTRTTAFACAVALRLPLEQTKELLMSAGYAFSHSVRMDVIVEYFISNGIYDIDRINDVLYSYDLQPLGSI